jgi:glycosyltransferase involved in cell wall biosynthesis
MRVAIVHDWLTLSGGAEKVLESILRMYPSADLFCVVDFLPEAERGYLQGRKITTTFIQHLPFARKNYRSYLPLMPLAIEQLDLTSYDLVISSTHAVAKGVITGPNQVHVCYCYSPIRYAWDLTYQYLAESGLTTGKRGWIAKCILHYIRIWDSRTANGVDAFMADSRFVARRIKKCYGRDAITVYPPIELEHFQMQKEKQNFYLAVSRFVPYKRIDLIVDAFRQMPERHLIVVGDGPDKAKIKALAAPNIEFVGRVPRQQVISYMQRAKAFVFAAQDDFGIVPVEAQACGTPVIAYGRGGALETVNGHQTDLPTGVFFQEQTAQALCAAIDEFEVSSSRFTAENCRLNASRFSLANFENEFRVVVDQAMSEAQSDKGVVSFLVPR